MVSRRKWSAIQYKLIETKIKYNSRCKYTFEINRPIAGKKACIKTNIQRTLELNVKGQ